MDTLSRIRLIATGNNFPFPTRTGVQRPVFMVTHSVSPFKTSFSPGGELIEEEILKTFLKERKLNGDFITKVSDIIWQGDLLNLLDSGIDELPNENLQEQQGEELDDEGGFLKLSKAHNWVLGDNAAPLNKKAIAKELLDDREKRKKLNLLNYEALKRELMLVSVGIGTACSMYCLVVFSLQAAISYALGVLFSLLYLRLLFIHADTLSTEIVPEIFRHKKLKKIGIRSEDLSDALERSIKGSGIALYSPRLVIPAAIYGLWVLSERFLPGDLFDFQLVPAMFGMFVYKAAALVQVYRDNKDLRFVFPENEEGSSY